jgi:hypothetical protein
MLFCRQGHAADSTYGCQPKNAVLMVLVPRRELICSLPRSAGPLLDFVNQNGAVFIPNNAHYFWCCAEDRPRLSERGRSFVRGGPLGPIGAQMTDKSCFIVWVDRSAESIFGPASNPVNRNGAHARTLNAIG